MSKKEAQEGFNPNLLTPEPRRPRPLTPEEREELAKPREPSKLLIGDEVPQHLRAPNPPPKETAPAGTRTVNENTASYKEMLDALSERKAQEAINEARDPKRLRVMRDLQSEREKMQVKSDAKIAAEKTGSQEGKSAS